MLFYALCYAILCCFVLLFYATRYAALYCSVLSTFIPSPRPYRGEYIIWTYLHMGLLLLSLVTGLSFLRALYISRRLSVVFFYRYRVTVLAREFCACDNKSKLTSQVAAAFWNVITLPGSDNKTIQVRTDSDSNINPRNKITFFLSFSGLVFPWLF